MLILESMLFGNCLQMGKSKSEGVPHRNPVAIPALLKKSAGPHGVFGKSKKARREGQTKIKNELEKPE